jgi:hypothetical protein
MRFDPEPLTQVIILGAFAMPKSTSRFVLSCALSACSAAVFFLSGCGASGISAPSNVDIPLTQGTVFGGQQPVAGAHIYLYAMNTTNYGAASTSLMTVGAPGTATDGHGVAYVTSGSDGTFSYGGTYANCTSGKQIYLLALGGNAAGVTGPSNAAIALAAALGDCANLTTSTFTNIDEATTVAMAYAFGGFIVDPTHIGAKSTNFLGLQNAYITANNLVDSVLGTARATTPAGNGVVSQQTINTLADVIAACVNSPSGSTQCANLMSYALSATSATPTDTFTAMHNIAAAPAEQVANIYGLTVASAPFQPALTTQPNDFSLGITFSATPVVAVQPGSVVIDATGNIWTSSCQSCINPTSPDSILQFSPAGVLLHSYTGSATPGTQVLHRIQGIALDATSSNIYIVNQGIPGGPTPGIGDDQIIKMSTTTGTVQAGFPMDFGQGIYGVDNFQSIALDNSGELWATAGKAFVIIEFNPSGNLINGSPIFIAQNIGVATDNIGNIWFADTGGNTIIEFDTNGSFNNNFTPSGLNQPVSIAINASNEVWTINIGSQILSRLDPFTGINLGGSPFTVGINTASNLAIDGANQVLIPNCRVSCAGSGSTLPDNLLRINQSGNSNTGGTTTANSGAQISTFSNPTGAAIDAAGNVWVSNNLSGKLTEVVGFAAPTIQPLANASTNAKIGQLP